MATHFSTAGDRAPVDEAQVDRLFELEPVEDPRCGCPPKFLLPTESPQPELCEAWRCSRCGNLVIRLHGSRQR